MIDIGCLSQASTPWDRLVAKISVSIHSWFHTRGTYR